ncbi:hypothetical protein Slin14017_G053900 [Septoria linicola]|nr:hypothetical protein Slin14017_G053900 [Septoria linicola]
MPPPSRGTPPKPLSVPTGFQSKSTPNLPTLKSLKTAGNNAGTPSTLHPQAALSPDIPGDNITSPSEPASIEDFSLDSAHEPPSLSPGSSEVDSGEDEDGHVPNLPTRPIYHHHSRSHTYLGPSAFAPPFYGRPPTPLPPSPSLTSLLRPTFSTHNSRPTTPDPSSDEGAPHTRGDLTGTQTPNSAAASTLTSTFRSAKPIPRASPKVPTYEYYGFTLYLTSSLAFIVYLLWSFLPSPFLHQLGIYYYPNRWWALAVPAWTVMLIVYIYVALASYNVGYLTLPLKSVECLVDEAANVAVIDASGKIIRNEKSSWKNDEQPGHKQNGSIGKKSGPKTRGGAQSRQSSISKAQLSPELDWRTLWNEGTDAVMDIPIGGVCEILYGAHDEDEDAMQDYGE